MFAPTKRAIMAIRAAHPALRSGTLEYFANADIAAFKRTTATDEVLVIVNVRNAAKTFNSADGYSKHQLDGCMRWRRRQFEQYFGFKCV
ncbi:MAG: hypothetical protein IPL27_28325 [Lewinellaceae bacterium]|nr:hypothetical protein [Lewinellaceae bacterium]